MGHNADGLLADPPDQLRAFVRDGRITTMPARGTRRRLLLDQDAQAFEPSRTYPEAAVNEVLKTIFDDYCALRRYLVDEVFLSRTAAGTYWRAGGTVGYRVPYVARRYVPIRRAPAADPLMSVPDRQC